MSTDINNPLLALVNPGVNPDQALMKAAKEYNYQVIFHSGAHDQTSEIKNLANAGAKQLKILPRDLLSPNLVKIVQESGIETLWMDCHPLWMDEPERLKEELSALPPELEIIPILTCPESISLFVHPDSPFRFVALKGREGWGPVGSEPLSLLFSLFKEKAGTGPRVPRAIVWGGLARPEAVAAYLACGAAGAVFERLALVMDHNGLKSGDKARLKNIRPEQAAVVGADVGLPLKLFDKGISPEVDRLRREIAALDPQAPDFKDRFRGLAGLDQTTPTGGFVSAKEIPFGGPEEAFASSMARRFGTEPAGALSGFREEICRSWEHARATWDEFLDSPFCLNFGLEYPFVQGAMAWITDNPKFATAVSQAGGLPTVSLGLRDRAGLEQDLSGLEERLNGRAYAVNLLVLPENTSLEDQLAWITDARPDLTVMVGFNQTLLRRLKEASLKVACLATDKAGMALALRSGADYLILEGNEAGGHVGPLSTLTLAQTALDLREEQPELFAEAGIILAGGIFDQETAFRAAMLGALGVQMGTAYLATEEIIATGSLSPLYQQMIVQARLGRTVVTGESLGLSVRALDTAKIGALKTLEKEIQTSDLQDAEARLKVEQMVAGSLFVAAKSRPKPNEEELDQETCRAQGQFLAGANAGLVKNVTSLSKFHHSLARGSFRPVTPPARNRRRNHAAKTRGNSPERIAITGMAVSNALGNSVERILAASLAMESGISRVSSPHWDHDRLYDPDPRAANKTYCRVGAFQNLDISRKELGIPPQDFRTMSDSTRQTLWLADQAIKDSGLLDSGLAPERIGVIVSQNSGEASKRLRELIINVQTPKLLEAVRETVGLDPDQTAALEKRLQAMGLETDDTTLLGRLNCAAGGFISNKYGFRGPCFAVTAACATGLVALYNAYTLIRSGVIDAAVVGGGEENLSEAHYLEFSALGALAGISGQEREPRATSRPFDAGRDGMVLGEGGGLIVIERESSARARGAGIKAFITSMGASNNDRGMVESLAETQVLALNATFNGLAYGPRDIGLVECHATSTIQGDLEEIKALKSIFPQGDAPVLSAFKSQIGHTLGASGLNGLIRTVAVMGQGILPGTLNYDQPDPKMDLEEWGFRVLPEPEPWPIQEDRPKRALVNAFGFGGANYVVTLEENQEDAAQVFTNLPLGASGPGDTGGPPIPGVSFFQVRSNGREIKAASTLERGDKARQLIQDAGESLFDPAPKTGRKLAAKGIFTSAGSDGPRPLALVMAGQGTYYPGMGREIYQAFEPFKKTMDRIAALAEYDLLGHLFSQEGDGLRHTRWQQPALFALEYALARYLLDLGVKPTALAGHSLGELVALGLAGVYSLEDGFGIVDKRALCMAKAADMAHDPGAMLAVDPRQPGLAALVEKTKGVYYTNHNSPAQAVLGGPTQLVLDLQKRLLEKGLRATRLKVSMAFHSPIMKVIREEMAEYVGRVEFHAPRIPVVSNTTGLPYPDSPEKIRSIIMAHLESPVLWQQNVETLWHDFQVRHFVEIGPRDTLSAFIADTLPRATCFQACQPEHETVALRSTLARLYCQGHLVPEKPAALINLPVHENPTHSTKPVFAKNNGLDLLVQEAVNRFVLNRFGDLIKPDIVREARRSLGPGFSVQDLENHLRGEGRPKVQAPALVASPASAPSPPKKSPVAVESGDYFLEEVIRIIMEATGYDRDEIEPDMDLRQKLAIRSSRFPVIIDAAEQAFGITIEWTDFIDVRTVRELADRVAQVAQRNGASPLDRPTPNPASSEEKLREDLPKVQGSPNDRENLKPLLRVVDREADLDLDRSKPLDLPQGGTVALLAPSGQATATKLAQHLTSSLGLKILNLDCLDPAHNLADPQGAARAADLIRKGKNVVGLILVLDGQAQEETDSAAPAFLQGCFTVLKSFLERPDKAFCLSMAFGQDQPDRSKIIPQGLAGMFLTAALEYNSVLFQALDLDQASDPGRVLDLILTQAPKPVQISFRDNQAFTLQTKVEPSLFGPAKGLALDPGRVVVVSGGGRGICSHLAQALAPWNPKLILLGRSALDHPKHGPEIERTLARLNQAGLEAEYFACDVTDAAQVENVMAQVEQRHGPIQGLIHGAGLIKDAFTLFLSEDGFRKVVEVKLAGVANLLAATEKRGLRFLAGLSSAAALLGSPGQINYTCANKAMTAFIRGIDKSRPHIKGRVLVLPPISGAGMANDPETKQLMELKGLAEAYVDLKELKALFRRELFGTASPDRSLGWLRDLPRAKTALLDLTPPRPVPLWLDCGEMRVPSASAPMIGRVRQINLKTGFLEAERNISSQKDLWLPDHRPAESMKHPLVSGVMAVETVLETAKLLHPDLGLRALQDMEFKEILECPQDRERLLRIEARSRSLGARGAMVEVLLLSRDISPSGRILDSETLNYRGRILMDAGAGVLGPDREMIQVNPEELDTGPVSSDEMVKLYREKTAMGPRYRVLKKVAGSGPGIVKGSMIYPDLPDFSDLDKASCAFPIYALEGLTQLIHLYPFLRNPQTRELMLPAGFDSLSFTRLCRPKEELTLSARLLDQDGAGFVWDARAFDGQGQEVLAVWGFRSGRIDHPLVQDRLSTKEEETVGPA